MKRAARIVDGSGREVAFGRELGRGGEGSVFEIAGRSDLAAKVYHKPLPKEKQEKIEAMVRLKTERLLRFTVWPVDVLRDGARRVIGFLMPVLSGKEIHKLYGPKTRLTEFPQAGYSFLIHTAANLARAFAAVHEAGHVVGDINHSNFYVTDQATILMLDCDSFQVQSDSTRFGCDVGIPMYMPPELQGAASFRGIVRTRNHDNFGLAVFIFMLLFMGRHPFAGKYSGSGDMPIERAIREFRFAYGPGASSRQMQPPPGALPIHVLPPEVQSLFARAFSQDSMTRRPDAQEWIAALQDMGGSLVPCAANPWHQYPASAGSCPWCAMEGATGGLLFRPADPARGSAGAAGAAQTGGVHRAARDSAGGFQLPVAWTQIQRVPPPPPARTLPEPSSLPSQPSEPVAAYLRRRKRLGALSILSLAAAAGVWIFLPGFWMITAGSLAGFNLLLLAAGRGRRALRSARTEERDLLRLRWNELSRRYAEASEPRPFADKLQELERARNEYLSLESFKAAELRRLQAKQRSGQMKIHLRRHRIEQAHLDGIGPGRKASLALFGIETALEVETHRLARVPGFGPANTRMLLAWRDRIERRFVFDPVLGRVPQAEVLAVERAVEARTRELERRLSAGASELMRISSGIRSRQEAALREAGGTAQALAQAELDVNAL
ncbi:protein kinase domain-containing protein [Saccharibacillus alkalitolerans]|uniref:Protein kinase domain-containing protein n=1 Tax=Saccharibacillus alkalitolerans TaxID=2705290 RepID=A0ABX0F492_9BACL|nr:hypothetical protein [Saccharibacillus alkalitolerans]NGZ75193.1 hypothetical protein [Saccharibacillus alkalitolerans]